MRNVRRRSHNSSGVEISLKKNSPPRQSQTEWPSGFRNRWCFLATHVVRSCGTVERLSDQAFSGYNAMKYRSNAGESWMTVAMPQLDGAVLARRAEIVAALKRIVPGEGVIASEEAMRPYESDGLTAYRAASDGGGAAGDDRAGRRRAWPIAIAKASRWCRAGPGPRCPAARCRSATASCSAWPSSIASARSISTIASPWSSPASPISRSPRRSSMPASITRRIRPRRSPAPSAAMSRKIPAACIA